MFATSKVSRPHRDASLANPLLALRVRAVLVEDRRP